jgi:hypothetical protein
VTGVWSNLHNEELHNICCSPGVIRIIKSRRMALGTEYGTHGENMNVYRILVGTPEGKIPLRRYRYKWGDNIKMDLREIGWGGVEWSRLLQDRDQWRAPVNSVMNLRVL